MDLVDPTPFSTPSSSEANASLAITEKLLDDATAQINALAAQHKALASLLRSLHHDEVRLRERLREEDPERWKRTGRDEWTQMQHRFMEDNTRLKADNSNASSGGVAVLQQRYGRGSMGSSNATKRTKRGLESPSLKERKRKTRRGVAIPEEDSAPIAAVSSDTEHSPHGGPSSSNSNVHHGSSERSPVLPELDTFLQFMHSSGNRKELGLFNPYFEEDDDLDGEDDEESIVDADVGFESFGNGRDLEEVEEGTESAGVSSAAATPPSVKE
ncbi:hypothetical protein HDU98_011726 [Podochytrium sp. JEL0797]|nr:hypothetical protein HDU98_011726 [Podochytrium sp. JEL0797]